MTKKSTLFDGLESHLRAISKFLNQRGHRERYLATCVPNVADQRRVEAWAGKYFDFKWQYMTRLLVQLLPELDLLISTFDITKIENAEAVAAGPPRNDYKADAEVLRDCGRALKTPRLKWKLTLLSALSSAFDREVTWCEGCHDHEHLLQGAGSIAARAKRYAEASRNCMWKGARQCQLICGELALMLERVRSSKSSVVRDMMSAAGPFDRVTMVGEEKTFKEALSQQMSDKLNFS